MMTRALALAARGRFWAAPNPHVGCVIARQDTIIGEGFTQPPGGAHAEVVALAAAGDARGATAYVTLEPCNHVGKTGPCTEALIGAGIARVVAAMRDPNPLVAGAGLARLAQAGIAVDCGILESEAATLLAGFVLRMTRGTGRLRCKLAMSLDGRTAMASGESQWITGAAARGDVQYLRAESGAIITGIGTVLADDCALTVRREGFGADEVALLPSRGPLRVVLDSQLRTPATAKILNAAAPTLLLHAAGADEQGKLQGAAMAQVPSGDDGLDLQAVLALLAEQECNEVLLECGPRLAGAFLGAGLIDELIVYMAPCLLGDAARPLMHLSLHAMADKVPLQITDMRPIGADWRITAVPQLPAGRE